MKTLHLIAGTPEWHAHRATHFNASDAPAMLGCSPYTSRAELLRKLHTGLSPEVDSGTQRRFDDGHRFEALARPLAEQIIGDDLAPVVGTEGELSASFDGLTLMGDTAWEHKTLNDELRACMKDQGNGYGLPKHYQVQMEQQLMVSGAERVLFMASKWEGDTLVEERHCWYASDPALRREIIAGWKQFAEDLASYQAPEVVQKLVAEPVQALPAVAVQVSGALSITDNFRAFETALRDFLEHRLIRDPKTDQDFADLDVQIKAMKGAEAALESAEAQMLAQIQSVDQAKKTKDMLADLVRKNRLMAEKLLASEKERRRGEIVAGGVKALADHVQRLNERLAPTFSRVGVKYMPTIPADFGGCIKGMKSLASMEDKVATELARAKIAANEIADRIQANLTTLREQAAEVPHLFPDTAAIVLKTPEDLQSLVTARIAEHRAAEERRLEAERARIRAEEQAKLQREQEAAARRQREEDAANAAAQALAESRKAQALPEQLQNDLEQAAAGLVADLAVSRAAEAAKPPAANVLPMPTKAPAPAAVPTLKLGDINARIGRCKVTADDLVALGFPAAGRDRAAMLYHAHDLPRIIGALIQHLQAVQLCEAA